MAPNTKPIYSLKSDLQVGGQYNSTTIIGPTANTATDGTGSAMYRVFVGSGAEGNFVQKCIFKAVASPAATVIRLWFGQFTGTYTANTTNTAANMAMLGELTTAAWTASNTLASPQYEIPVNMIIPTGTSLLVSFGTSTGSAGNGFTVATPAGQY